MTGSTTPIHQTHVVQNSAPLQAARGSNLSGVRAHNERLVLTLIRERGPLAKSDIARLSGLSAQTVSVIMRALELDGLLIKGAPVRGKVGQPSVPMALNPQGAYFFGLKIGRRSLDLVLTDFLGTVQGRLQHTHSYPSPQSVIEFAQRGMSELMTALPKQVRARVAGLGIALPFNLWDWSDALGVDPCEMEAWRHCDIRAEIQQNWDFPVTLENDATAACGAQLVFGADRPAAQFLYLYIGFFIGGGVVLNNTLFTGSTGNAGAIGSTLAPNPHTGQPQQLVELASLAQLEQSLEAQGLDGSCIWHVAQDWDIPDTLVEAWIDQAAKAIAYACTNACAIMDLSDVIVDGWLPHNVRSALRDRIEQEISMLSLAGMSAPTIHCGTIGRDARALGAASLPLSERYLIDHRALTNT